MSFFLQHGFIFLLFSLKIALACVDGNCRILAFPAPFFFDHKHLVNHTIRNEDGVDFDVCQLLCYHEDNCVSINYDLITRRCELNNATHRGHDNEFVYKENSLYHGADSACDRKVVHCKNNGTCQSGFTDKQYRCLCLSGFTGERCEKDINECKAKTNSCGKNAKCKNNKGSYSCICKTGYSGDGQTCSDINECTARTHNCSDDAVCNNTKGSFNCTCKPGYSGNGNNCTDINECEEETHNCSGDAGCSNTKGSYNCSCDHGYSGDGRNCTDINECEEETRNCSDDAVCSNTKGSYNCNCNPGYSGDGRNCTDIDECVENVHNCIDEAVCTNTNGFYNCSCDIGYNGDGENCTDINECEDHSHKCDTDDECINKKGSYSCKGPVAFFPLNITYGTKEINNRTTQGISHDVSLTPGPDGKANGSFEFIGSWNSFIEFKNRAGGALNVRYSMTMLCWLLYNGKDGWIARGIGLSVFVAKGKLSLRLYYRYYSRHYYSYVYTRKSIRSTIGGGWKFVGASYDHKSGEAKLWIDGEVVGSKPIGTLHKLATLYNIKMGVNIKARITQMLVYNEALTQKQIQTIQNRTRRAEVSSNSSILSMNESYVNQLEKFLQPAVGNGSRWLLCYRASLHGWDASFFHNLCDGKMNTITIVKKDQYVFGGYTDIPWDSSGGYAKTSIKAFIFSLRNKEGLAPFKSLVKPRLKSFAIYRHSSYGPIFGGGHDIHIAIYPYWNSASYTNFGHSYNPPSGVKDKHTILAGTYNFSPDEVEVFYLYPSH